MVRLDGQARFWCGLDLSSGMLGDARARVGPAVPLVLGDVARLPFASRTFDVVLCLWVLYHVADPVYALREIDRVLAEDGMLIAATNSSRPRATDEIVSASLEAATGRRIDVWLPPLTFDAENAPELLDQVFARVEAAERVAAFAVPGPEPVLAAIESTRGPMEMTIGEPIDWPAFEAEARRLIEARIARDGVFRTEIVATTFLCSQGRRP